MAGIGGHSRGAPLDIIDAISSDALSHNTSLTSGSHLRIRRTATSALPYL